MLLEPLLGAVTREWVLVFLTARAEGYAREIADTFQTSLEPIQKQLARLEAGGVLFSRTAGRTRLYSYNPRYPFLAELTKLLERALEFYPQPLRDKLVMDRRRPRGADKRP